MSTVIPLRSHRRLSETIIGEIKAWMARRGFSQTDLAKGLGKHPSQLSKRLSGAIAIDADELEAIAQLLDVDPVVFLRPSVVPWPDGGGDDDPGQPSAGMRENELERAARRHRGHGAPPDTHRYAA